MSLLVLDRKLDAETRDELDARPPGRDDHGFGRQRAVARIELPARCRRPERVHRRDPNVRSGPERLHDRLRPVEVAVLLAPRRPSERLGPQPGHECCRLLGPDDPRRDTLRVLDCDIRPQPLERRLGVGGEEIAKARKPSSTGKSRSPRPRARRQRTRRRGGRRPPCPTAGAHPPAGCSIDPIRSPSAQRRLRPRHATSGRGRWRVR